MQHSVDHFEALFTSDVDPWKFRSRWYERRKRALTLACLPQLRYASGYEPGCANGELSAALATRCEQLTVSDGSALAVGMATARLADLPHVTVTQAWVPLQWPEDTFDLIVISEFGFYLDAHSLHGVADRICASIRPGGTVLACHWRRPIEGCQFNGDQVHQILLSRMQESQSWTSLCQIQEPDMVLDVWSLDTLSVAQREGFA